MKCIVDGVEYERVESNTYICCKGCVAEGWSEVALNLCGRLADCSTIHTGEDSIWVKVEHASNS